MRQRFPPFFFFSFRGRDCGPLQLAPPAPAFLFFFSLRFRTWVFLLSSFSHKWIRCPGLTSLLPPPLPPAASLPPSSLPSQASPRDSHGTYFGPRQPDWCLFFFSPLLLRRGERHRADLSSSFPLTTNYAENATSVSRAGEIPSPVSWSWKAGFFLLLSRPPAAMKRLRHHPFLFFLPPRLNRSFFLLPEIAST